MFPFILNWLSHISPHYLFIITFHKMSWFSFFVTYVWLWIGYWLPNYVISFMWQFVILLLEPSYCVMLLLIVHPCVHPYLGPGHSGNRLSLAALILIATPSRKCYRSAIHSLRGILIQCSDHPNWLLSLWRPSISAPSSYRWAQVL